MRQNLDSSEKEVRRAALSAVRHNLQWDIPSLVMLSVAFIAVMIFLIGNLVFSQNSFAVMTFALGLVLIAIALTRTISRVAKSVRVLRFYKKYERK